MLEPGVNSDIRHSFICSYVHMYVQIDQDFTRTRLRCVESLNLGRNGSGFIVNASFVLLGYLEFGHFECEYKQIKVGRVSTLSTE